MANAHETGRLTVPLSPELQGGLHPELEQNLRAIITPERARLIAFAATKKTEFFSPVTQTVTPDLETSVKLGHPAELPDNLPFTAGERVSEKRRKAYWQEGERANLSFAEQNKQWNEGLHTAIRRLITKPEDSDLQKIQKAELAKETLHHLGLTGADDTQEKTFTSAQKGSQTVSLYSDIEAFRLHHFDEKSDIKGFVKKVAKLCTNAQGTVDIANLHKRIIAIKPLLASFGDQSVDSLVEDYVVSYGLLTQTEAHIKDKIVSEATSKLQAEITVPLQKRNYEAITQYQEEIDREEAQRQQPQGEPAQQIQVFPPPATAPEQHRQEDAGREPVSEPTAGGQPDTPGQPPEPGEFDRKVAYIEEKLQEQLEREVHLSPRQQEVLRNLPQTYTPQVASRYDYGRGPISDDEFILIFSDQYRRLKGKNKSHDEIMRELDQILGTIQIDKDRIDEEGEEVIVAFKEEDERGFTISCDRSYPRIPHRQEDAGRETLSEPTPGGQSEALGQQPENGEFDRKAALIEEKLQERLGREVALSPRQKEILRTMPESYISQKPYTGYDFGEGPITENEFIHIFSDQYRRLKAKNKSHDEIMDELDQILGTIRIDEEDKEVYVIYGEEERGARLDMDRGYPRIQ